MNGAPPVIVAQLRHLKKVLVLRNVDDKDAT